MVNQIEQPQYKERQQSYEVDEFHTKVEGRLCWISYDLSRGTKQIMSFFIGNSSKDNLLNVINDLLLLSPKRIYTDRLPQYKSLIPVAIHKNARFQTNRIEHI